MSVALIALAGTGKTAPLCGLRDALPEARYHDLGVVHSDLRGLQLLK
jgi:hypothetical protein